MVAKLGSPPKTADAPIEVTPGDWPDRELSPTSTPAKFGIVPALARDGVKYASVIRVSGARFDQ
jgi:hypothetical protein